MRRTHTHNANETGQCENVFSLISGIYFLFFDFDTAHKRKIYDNRCSHKNSYYHHNHHHHHHHSHYGNNTTPQSSTSQRRGNRCGGFTFRGLFEPTPFYRLFGSTKTKQSCFIHKSSTTSQRIHLGQMKT